ncbi:MAG TPA: hypothetical protein VK498_14205 [Ferruginibacter sp.]|nr:hypothetical protein [Ferruginibacter sp.]
MGLAELDEQNRQLIIHSVFILYGDAASENLTVEMTHDVQARWNEPGFFVTIKENLYQVIFNINGNYAPALVPSAIFENDDPRNNYFRIEEFASADISFVDGIGSNTGYFKLANLLNGSSTAAHEYGHTLGLEHPEILDIRGKGQPGIMYPRGTIVDPEFQYDPTAPPLQKGGTINPFTRKVTHNDMNGLKLGSIHFKNGFSVVGEFTSIWHEKHLP